MSTPPVEVRSLRKEILVARIALQRVEFSQDLRGVHEHLNFASVVKNSVLGGGAGVIVKTLLGFAQRRAAVGRLAQLVLRDRPRAMRVAKWVGVALALWPVVNFAIHSFRAYDDRKRRLSRLR